MKRTALAGCVIASCLLAGCEEGEPRVVGTDLTVVDLRIPNRTAVRQGSTVTMRIVVLNNGTETAQASKTPFTVSLQFYSDAAFMVDHPWTDVDIVEDGKENGDIPAGEHRAYDIPITVLPDDPVGMVFCVAFVDINDDVEEAKEDNNVLARSCQVVGGGGDLPPTLPDLTATMSAAASMTVDTAYNVSVTLTNSGGETADQPFSVAFAVRNAAGGDIRTQEVWDVGQDLAPAADVSHDFPFTPAATDGVTVYFVATVDSTFAVTEGNETNNESSEQSDIVVLQEPDLTISFTSPPASVPKGGDLDVQVTVTNVGGADAVAPFTVKVESYADFSHTITLWSPETVVETVDLAAGANKTYDLTFTARVDDDIGDVYLVATVDSLGQVFESEEGNNEDQATSSVVLPNKPDLEILSIAAPNTMPHGVPVIVTVTITNTGGVAPLQQFWVSFDVYKDDPPTISIRGPLPWQEWQMTDPLPPGAQMSHDFSFDPMLADGEIPVWFVAKVDSRGQVTDEFITTNNTKSATSQIVLPPKPDLVAQIDSCSDTLDLDVGKISLSYTITNSGSGNALGSLARVELRDQSGALMEVLGTIAVPTGEFPVPSLAAGASHTATQNGLGPALTTPTGVYYDIVVIADGSDMFVEEDESNNEDLHPILIY